MADRFWGHVQLGGKFTPEQFDKCCDLLEECGPDSDITGKGVSHFAECTAEDFTAFANYCESNGLEFAIHWEGRYEYNAYTEFFVDGKWSEFPTDSEGNIVIRLQDIKASDSKTVAELIESLEIPVLPMFEISPAIEYEFATDSESGTTAAASWKNACAWLANKIPQESIDNGAWGWIESPDAAESRFYVAQENMA